MVRKYKAWIKGNILLAAGTTLGAYEKTLGRPTSDLDDVDKIIAEAALGMKGERYKLVFMLLYHCNSVSQVVQQYRDIHETVVKEASVRDYIRRTRPKVVELVIQSKETMDRIRKIITCRET